MSEADNKTGLFTSPANHEDSHEQDSRETSPAPAVKPEAHKDAPEEDPKDNEPVGVRVTDNQTEVTFKVKRKTPLHRVMDSFCKRTGKDPNSLRFLFDGERVNKDDTPGSLGMEDGDKIEALNQQTGGC